MERFKKVIDPKIIDPTENVKALNKASSKHIREMLKLEVRGLQREIKNQARLVAKTRKIDLQNQASINTKLQLGTKELAATIELTAKTLSSSVGDTARLLASQQEASYGRLADRVAVLERGQYMGAGQAGIRDPQIESLLAEVTALRTSNAGDVGKRDGLSLGASILISAVALVFQQL